MKKSLWGYNVDEVNETIEMLESQNETLSAKLSNLTMQLATKNEQLEALTNQAQQAAQAPVENSEVAEKLAKLEAETARLRETLRVSDAERDTLREENRRLAGQVGQDQDELNEVGEICRSAYADMALIKRQTYEEVQAFVDEFVLQAEKSQKTMEGAMQEIRAVKESAVDAVVQAVEEILEKFDAISAETNDVESVFGHVDQVKSGLMERINALMLSVNETPAQSEAQVQTKELEGTRLPPRLAQAMSEKKNHVQVPDGETPDRQLGKVLAGIRKSVGQEELETAERTRAVGSDRVLGVSIGVAPKDILDR